MPEIDPTNFDPALLLTAAGATVAAGLIASLIEALKRLAWIGPIVSKNPAAWATLASFGIVFVAYFTTQTVNAVGIFGAFVASLGVAAIAGKSYDVAVSVKAG